MTAPGRTTPLFIQIAETIKGRIARHEYDPGSFLSSSKDLAKEFNVSNITIRRAADILAQDGFIKQRRGMRAQVAMQDDEVVEIEITGDFRTWVNTAIGKKLNIKVEVIDRRVIPCPKPVQDILSIKQVERIKRVRKLKDIPVSYYVTYGPVHLLKKISTEQLEKRTFIDLYQDQCNFELKYMEQTVQALKADLDLVSVLDVDFGFPLFYVHNVYYSNKDIPKSVTHMYYRSDKYLYTAKRLI
ncbi:MAG: GntR family transcriptional regulator [Desulfobacteraceae bacterium]|nr:GntR family transcriptional regulator [Desulfobacteraceae bacterium]